MLFFFYNWRFLIELHIHQHYENSTYVCQSVKNPVPKMYDVAVFFFIYYLLFLLRRVSSVFAENWWIMGRLHYRSLVRPCTSRDSFWFRLCAVSLFGLDISCHITALRATAAWECDVAPRRFFVCLFVFHLYIQL